MTPWLEAFLVQARQNRQKAARTRTLTSFSRHDGTWLYNQQYVLNLSSNDYLGLSNHPALTAGAKTYLETYGVGSTASRLICGTLDIHRQLEQNLADWLGTEAALLFNSGYQLNSSVLQVLMPRTGTLFIDKLAHRSLLEGALATRSQVRRFQHNDVQQLEELLQAAPAGKPRLVITESVFSMDGDRAPVHDLFQLCNRYEAGLVVDEAHALGVLGPQGRGLTADIAGEILLIGTFGKAFGSAGAFLAGPRLVIDHLINHCPGFIYTTAPPPAVVGAVAAALALIPGMDAQRRHLSQLSEQLRQDLTTAGWQALPASRDHIIPVIVGEETATLRLADSLRSAGFWVSAIRPPTVPAGSARLRLSLSAEHEAAALEAFIGRLADVGRT